MGKLCVGRMVLGMVETNCYFIYDEDNKKAIVADPAKPGIFEKLTDAGFSVSAIVLTHGHFDHIMGVNELRDATGVKVYALDKEDKLLKDAHLNSSESIRRPYTVVADELLKDGQEVSIDGLTFKVIATPGHTVGSCCYYFEKDGVMLTGDTLFAGSIGRTDLPTGNEKAIMDSVHMLMETIPKDVKVYPGHGNSSVIGEEKRYNPFCR